VSWIAQGPRWPVCIIGKYAVSASRPPLRYTALMTISNIPDERLDEFRRLYVEEFGEELSREEASIRAMQLIDLCRLLMELETRNGPPPAQSNPAAS
jgi:hypothetical protein